MLYEFRDLPPETGTEHVELAKDKMFTFYRVPTPSQGPELRKNDRGRYMEYMYSHFVFRWYAGTSTVYITHGNLDGTDNMPLPWTFTIETNWDRVVLAERGKQWVRQHRARFHKGK